MMTIQPCPRYVHSEGHLDVCYDDTGEHILTCGPDGDIRIYKGFDDDDPISHPVGDRVYAIAFKKSKFYAASDDNAIQAVILDECQPDGIITRFTAHATHIVFNASGSTMVAGASDFTVKIVNVETSSQRALTGHSAPILSVSLHPKELFVASSSCDGTVRVWSFADGLLIKSITCLKKCNDWATSKTLCRLVWDQTGKYLFVPIEKVIRAYDAQTWDVSFELADSCVNQMLSVCSLSSCAKYLAAATVDGQIVVWELSTKKCIAREKLDRGHRVTGLAWNPNTTTNEIAYCDDNGYLGVLRNIVPASSSTSKKVTDSNAVKASDLFDDDFNDDMVAPDDDDDAVSAGDGRVPGVDTDVEEDDDDDNDSIRPTQKKSASKDDKMSDNASSINGATLSPIKSTAAPVIMKGWEPVALQTPFQSGSTPCKLSTRFMMWNAVGIVIQYNTDDEQSINVEFHDTATHHSIHVQNSINHSIADLSTEALLLACEAGEDNASQLVCMHFASWDNCKEWTTTMPKGEDVQVVCLGNGWLAAATDQRLIRLYSIGGVQLQIFSLTGPVISIAAHQDKLFVAYHDGLGVTGDQCVSTKLLSIVGRKSLFTSRLPLSAKSTLTWLGLSNEGTPYCADSAGIVRQFSRGFADTWCPVADLKQHCKGKTDNVWLIGINESSEQIRGVLCKGAKYPPILPRPTVQLLPFQLPLCEPVTDKSVLEENYWRSMLIGGFYERWLADGTEEEFDERAQQKVVLNRQESLMKQFALACKTKREYRAVELAQMMPNSRTVQLAIRYASQTGLMLVAQRLNEVARQKADEEMGLNELREMSRMPTLNTHSSAPLTRPTGVVAKSHTASSTVTVKSDEDDEDNNDDDDVEDDDNDSRHGDIEDVNVKGKQQAGPVMLLHTRKSSDAASNAVPKSLLTSQSSLKKNPFKVANMAAEKTTPMQCKGTSVFDSMEKIKPGKTATVVRSTGTAQSVSMMTTSSQKKSGGGSLQTKLFGDGNAKAAKQSTAVKQPAEREGTEKEDQEEENIPVKTGFQLWFDANKSSVCTHEEDSELSESEQMIIAAKRWRQLSKEIQQEWQDKATRLKTGTEITRSKPDKEGKRKRDEMECDDTQREVNTQNKDHDAISSVEGHSLDHEDKKAKKAVLATKTTNKLSSFNFMKS